jgi:hypothetical protein
VDFAVLFTGLAVSICQAMPPDAAGVFIRSLEGMAERNVSPAEAHIFQAVAEALKAGGAAARKPTLTMIQGGAA